MTYWVVLLIEWGATKNTREKMESQPLTALQLATLHMTAENPKQRRLGNKNLKKHFPLLR
jgi:hypothetical protein